MVTRVAKTALPAAHGESPGEAQGLTGAIWQQEELVAELRPELRFYPKKDEWIKEVSIERRVLGDIYLYYAAREPDVECKAAPAAGELPANYRRRRGGGEGGSHSADLVQSPNPSSRPGSHGAYPGGGNAAPAGRHVLSRGDRASRQARYGGRGARVEVCGSADSSSDPAGRHQSGQTPRKHRRYCFLPAFGERWLFCSIFLQRDLLSSDELNS